MSLYRVEINFQAPSMYRCRTQVQHELVAELVNRGVLTSMGAEEVCHDLIADKRALASERRRKQAAVALLHVDHARGRAVDLTASQQQILDLRLTNAFRSASTHADPGEDAP